MYSTTNVFGNTVRGNDRKFTVKIKCGKNESTDAIKSLKQYSQLPSDCLTIGGAFPSTLELTLWNPGFSLQNKEFQVELGLEIEDGTTEWCPLGFYTSESFKESSDGMITITAYDRIYSKMSGAYFSKLTYPADALDVLNEISQKTGVEIQTANLTSGVNIQKRKVVSNKEIDENGNIEQVTTYENPFDGYTYREALGYIAMLFCKYAIADRNGSVKFVWFNEIENYKVTADYYYELTTNETAFSVGKITCNTGEKEFEVGSGTNNIQLANPIMTQDRLNYIYEVVKTLTFIPSHFPFYGDMRLDIGDVIKVVKTDGSIYSVPIMSVTQEFDGGLRTSVQSFGGLEQETEMKGPLATRLERQYTELLLVKELVGEKASFDNLYALSGEFGSLKADYGEFEKLVTKDFETVNADIINLKANSITTDNLDAKLAEIGALTAETADLKYATIVDLNALNGKFEELSAKSITTGNLSANVANLGYLKADEADIKYAKIETLETEYLQLKNLSAETAKLGYLTAIEADIGYAKIDFSNVGKQVVSSSMIMDSAVTNEKVANLSANKITSGTIDASMIRVINLNADNLTVGTINGKLIGNSSVDLDKLSEEVPTKEYLDGELSSLKAKTTTLETSMGNKVEKSVFNELKQTVDENSSKIVSLTTTVSKKADSSTVTTLTNNVNEIRQTATQNTASISGMKADIEKKADGSTVSSLATKVSSVEQNLDGFKTTVSNTYTTKNELTTAVDGIQIGGRNLWLKTKEYDAVNYAGWVDNNNGNRIQAQPYTTVNGFGVQRIAYAWRDISQRVPIEPNTLYTLSAWIKWENTIGVIDFYDNNAEYKYNVAKDVGNDKYKRISVTYNSGVGTISTCRFESESGVPYLIYGLKLEKGTKATDWTPAPEDLASAGDLSSLTTRVVSAESNITQLSNKITTEVSERTALGTRVSTLEQTASGLTVRLGNTESTANTALTNAANAQSTANDAKSDIDSLSKIATKTYRILGSEGRPTWLNLGTLKSYGDATNFVITVYSGGGYNGISGQNAKAEIVIKDGWQSSYSASAAFGVSVTRQNCDTLKVKVLASAHDVCDVWLYIPWGYWDGTYTIAGSYKSWTNNLMKQDAEPTSGTAQDVAYRMNAENASSVATNYLNFSNGGLVIGNLTASTLGRNVLIDSDSVDIRNGTTVLATFAENLIELGKNSTASVIKLCGGAGQFSTKTLSHDGVSYSTLTLYSNNGIELQANDGSMIHQQVSGGNLKNETYMFTDSTLFTKNIELEKGVKISSYADDILIDLVRTSGSNVIFGNGALNGASVVGFTSLRGYDINFMVGSVDTEYKPYYTASADDGVSDTWVVDGYISASALRVYFTIPLGKPIIGNPTVTVSSMNGLIIRENGNYVYGSASNTYVKPSQYIASVVGGNCIYIIAVFTDKTNAVTNHPCSVNASLAIDFS